MTKLVLNILLPHAKVSETYPEECPWHKRLEVVINSFIWIFLGLFFASGSL